MLTKLSAEQAKVITDENLPKIVVEKYLDNLLSAVKKKAEAGKSCLAYPFSLDNLGGFPSDAEKQELRRQLNRLGYEIKHTPDADPGNPCSHAYDILTWG